MAWLDRIAEVDGRRCVCEAKVADAALFADADGRVPSWVALEWMAQAMAVHGLVAASQGDPPADVAAGASPRALLAEVRELRFELSDLAPEARVRVEVVHERGTRVASFACRVTVAGDEALVASGRLSAVIAPALE